ncbi:MAG: aminopeptidase P family protein [Bacteroidetes bacterium]|nr:aminopeptidase P family protein [Bacteroidota bacterium]
MKYLLFFLAGFIQWGIAQSSLYDTDLLPADFHVERRRQLRARMSDNSVVVMFANPVRNRSNDVDYTYRQDPNFFYLTGFSSPNAMLLVFKTPQTIGKVTTDEILVIEPKDEEQEKWTGKRMTVKEVTGILKFKAACYADSFQLSTIPFASFTKIYNPYFYNDVRDDRYDKYDLFDLEKNYRYLTDSLKTVETTGQYRLMNQLREIKTPEELTLLRKAIDISCQAHLDLMKKLKTAGTEYQAQAIVEYGFRYNGAEDIGYPSIVGAGENGCVAHYTSNRKKFTKTDILVVDAGGEYHGYTADITRSLPVNGKYSEAQAIIYNLVLKAQEEGIKACKAGNKFRSTHEATSAVIKKGLVDLGIIKNADDYQLYFFHGTSHYLGLDVHDAGTYGELKPNSVITVEPGIYIPPGSPCDKKWWNIGVRIEDDVLITTGEPEVLSAKLPRSIAEIELLMNSVK